MPNKISACRSCAAKIIWLKTEKEKAMPVDAETVDDGDLIFDAKKHTSHFATCPDADRFRKARKK